MEWTKITVDADPRAEEVVSNILMEAGAKGVEIQGSESFLSQEAPVTWDVADPMEDSVPYGLSAYYPASEAEFALMMVRQRLDALRSCDQDGSMGKLAASTETVSDADWENSWKKYFQPVRVADFMVVKPTWVDYNADPDQVVIEVDPGMAFGTGNHETTRLCLALMEKFVHEGETVADVGCGSGVLALAAAKMGAEHVYALDVDPIAVEVTQQNAAVNGVQNTVEAIQSNLLSALPEGTTVDMVVCNIIADAIIQLTPSIPDVLRKNGMFLCSGIIADRLNDVLKALNDANLRVISMLRAGEWVGLACKHKSR